MCMYTGMRALLQILFHNSDSQSTVPGQYPHAFVDWRTLPLFDLLMRRSVEHNARPVVLSLLWRRGEKGSEACLSSFTRRRKSHLEVCVQVCIHVHACAASSLCDY